MEGQTKKQFASDVPFLGDHPALEGTDALFAAHCAPKFCATFLSRWLSERWLSIRSERIESYVQTTGEARIRVPVFFCSCLFCFFILFSVVYFSRGTLPQQRGEKGTTGGRRSPNQHLARRSRPKICGSFAPSSGWKSPNLHPHPNNHNYLSCCPSQNHHV